MPASARRTVRSSRASTSAVRPAAACSGTAPFPAWLRHSLLGLALGLLLGGVAGRSACAVEPPAEVRAPAEPSRIDFAQQIQPLLRTRCLSCHGAERQEAGLRLDQKRRAMAGGDHGAAIVPGRGAESRLVRVLDGADPDVGRMPPEDAGKPLDAGQIALLRRWIDLGADWPAAADSRETDAAHWAFRPPVDVVPPAVARTAEARTALDAYLLAKLEAARIEPSPEAPRGVLLRRLQLDLLGLPPDLEELDAFLADDSPDAWERAVDRALASPHFGERWGRHWLDLARYADSDGYEKDRPRPFAWRYRQWVIAAINADQPYDEFTRDQLAGDLAPDASIEQRIAVGFHRNTLHNTEGGADPEEDRVKKTVDRTNTLGAVWLGLTVGCAQCHSHKYDPLTQREYFALYAFFDSLQETDVDAPDAEDRRRLAERQAEFEVERRRLQAALDAYDASELAAAQARWETDTAPIDDLPDEIAAIVAAPAASRSADAVRTLGDFFRSIDVERNRRRLALERHSAAPPALPPDRKTQSVREADRPRETRVHRRGDFLSPGDVVGRGVFEVLPPLQPANSSPDRLDLARWLVDPRHPLTARVAVNRHWQQLFGRGLVATSDDFGRQGDPPSHPELLDRLALDFQRSGWSVKQSIRSIVVSAAYRRSSAPRADLASVDPENALLARQVRRRVEAEIVRDLTLAASGLLDRRVGGPSVRPRQPAEHASLTYAGSANWTPSQGGDAFRRGLYTFFQRTSPYPMLMTFDSPDSNETCVRRTRSNTPLQSLALWNDPVFVEMAQRFGRKTIVETPVEPGESRDDTTRRRAAHAFRLAVARRPAERESEAVVELYRRQTALASQAGAKVAELIGPDPVPSGADALELAGWTAVGRALMNLDEFLTRE